MTDLPSPAQASGDPFGTLTGPLAGTVRMKLEVVESGLMTPHMQRVVLTAPELASFEHLPGQDVMLLVGVEGGRPVRRRYTIRALDRDRQLLTLDVVRHSDGPGERWIRTAAPGVTIEGIAPRGKISPAPHTDWHLFIGDDSSLAAIFAMTESLPPDTTATVILEVPEPADAQELRPHAPVQLTWLYRRGSRPASRRRWPRRRRRSRSQQAGRTPTSSVRRAWCWPCARCSRSAGWSPRRSPPSRTGAAARRTRATASPARDG